MRQIRQLAAPLLCLLMAHPCTGGQLSQAESPRGTGNQALRPDPKKAAKLAEEGDKAQADGNVRLALQDYQEAARYSPQDETIVGRGALLRSKLVRDQVNAAERYAVEGDLKAATEAMRRALTIEPGNKIVMERLAQMQAMETEETPKSGVSRIEGFPDLHPSANRQSFDFRGDTRSVYERVAQAYGIKATFDPDLPSRSLRFRVQDVNFKTAVSVLCVQTGTFWRPVNPSLIFVAADTAEKRRQFEPQAQQTFVLPDSVDPQDVTELLRLLRELTGSMRIELDSRSRTITVRDTPEHLRLAAQIVDQAERAPSELLLEIELLEVNRNFGRKLGISSSWQSQLIPLSSGDVRSILASPDVGAGLTKLLQIFTAKGFSSVPPFVLAGGGLSTFLLTLPSATADFSDGLSLVHSGRQVLMRAEDGQPATFFVGDRYPVTLSLLSGSLGSGTANSAAFTGVPSSVAFPETTFDVGNTPSALTSRDFDGDGLPDIAAVNQADNSVSILLNSGDGKFKEPATSPILLDGTTEAGPVAITSAVLRTNTNTVVADLLVANSASNTVSVLLGNGDGTFTEASGSPFTVGAQPSAIVTADFNGDGFPDFAVANKGSNSISVFLGDGNGGFTQAANSPYLLPNGEQGPVAMVVANFRASNEPDLAVVNQTTNSVSILLASGDSTFNGTFSEAPNSPFRVGATPTAIAAADLNADGIPDVAVVNHSDNSVTILLSSANADGSMTEAAGSPLATPTTSPGPTGIAIADFTNDGMPDLAVTNQGVGTLGIYVGLGSGTFSAPLELETPAGPTAIISNDFNGDTLPDVALTSQASGATQGQVAVLLDNPSFATGTNTGQTPYPASEFVDLGVKVKATPTLHPDNEVTLKLDFEIRALTGSSVNGIPILSNRTLSQTVRVKENQTTLIGGLLDKEETHSISGLPGFSGIPGIGYAAGDRNTSRQDTELLILVTPHKLRLRNRTEQMILAGRGAEAGGRAGPRFVPAEGQPIREPEPQPRPQQPSQPEAPLPQPDQRPQ